MTVFLVLHPDAQEHIRIALDGLQYREVINADAIPRDEIAEIFRSYPPESIDVWYFFDAFMLVADEHDAFHIDLSGQVTLEPTESSDVLASVEGIDGEIVIKMTESPGGDWRVYQVIVPGGDAEDFPWSVPNRTP